MTHGKIRTVSHVLHMHKSVKEFTHSLHSARLFTFILTLNFSVIGVVGVRHTMYSKQHVVTLKHNSPEYLMEQHQQNFTS